MFLYRWLDEAARSWDCEDTIDIGMRMCGCVVHLRSSFDRHVSEQIASELLKRFVEITERRERLP